MASSDMGSSSTDSTSTAEEATARNAPVIYRIMLVGEKDVGKTKLARFWVDDPLEPNVPVVPGIHRLLTTVGEGEEMIIVHLWDTTGYRTVKEIDPFYIERADAILLIFDCTRRTTFNKMESWFKYLSSLSEPRPQIFILGTDFISSRMRQIYPPEMQELSDWLNVPVLSVSHSYNKIDIFNSFREIIGAITTHKRAIEQKRALAETSHQQEQRTSVGSNCVGWLSSKLEKCFFRDSQN